MTVLVQLPTGGHHLLILSGDNKISSQKLQRYSCLHVSFQVIQITFCKKTYEKTLIFLGLYHLKGVGGIFPMSEGIKKEVQRSFFFNICLNHLRPLQKHERVLQKYLRSTCNKSTNRILKPFFLYTDFLGPMEFSEDHRRDVYG